MSRAVPEWIGRSDDTPVPPRVRLRIAERDHFKCKKCTRQIGTGIKTDHIIALVNGGENRESNLQTLCDWCHVEKTAADVATKSKTYNMARKHAGIKKPSSFRGWRKFDGSPVFAKRS